MEWYVYTLLSALSVSIYVLLSKKALNNNIHAMEFRTTLKTFEIPFLLLLIPFVNFNLTIREYSYITAIAVIAVIAGIFWAKGIKHSEISTVSPLKNISPLFLVILSFIFLGEVVTLRQGVGIFILLIGTYVLEVDHKISHLKDPIMKIIKSKAIHFIFLSMFLYSFSAVGDKFTISNIDVITYFFMVWIIMTIMSHIISAIFYGGFKDVMYCAKKTGWTIFFCGLFSFLSALFYFKALSMAMVSLVIPVKRLSTLFTTIIGGELFHDHGLKIKAVACVILIAGSLLIVL